MQVKFQNAIEQISKVIEDPCIVLLIILIAISILSKCTKVTYFNFNKIIKEYIKSFNSKSFIVIKLVLIIIPTRSAATMSLITEKTINIITIIITVVTALFFCLLTFLPDMKSRLVENNQKTNNEAENFEKLINETYHIVMFEIFVCIIILFMCFMLIFSRIGSIYGSYVIYYLVFTMVSDMFVILSRIFNLIEKMLE